jgi:hypothetical protein
VSGVNDVLWEAGAVFYVRTTMPQTGMHLETSSNIYGVTLNPNNLTLTPGGSSGGEAALIALRWSVLVRLFSWYVVQMRTNVRGLAETVVVRSEVPPPTWGFTDSNPLPVVSAGEGPRWCQEEMGTLSVPHCVGE